MRKVLSVVAISFFGLFALWSVSSAQHHGGGATQAQPAMKMPSTEVFADGVQVTFMVMRNEMHKGMLKRMNMKEDLEQGTTNNIMVLIQDEKTGKELTGAAVTLKVVGPDGNEQVKTGSYKEMMRTYDAYFNLSEKGKYQVLALFELSGQKRVVGISHETAG